RLLHALGRQAEAGAAYALVFSLKGLFVGMEDGLARPATEFFRQDYESQRLASFSGVARLLGIYGRAGHTAIRWNTSNPSQPEVPEFRLGGHLQTGSGINYAVRF